MHTYSDNQADTTLTGLYSAHRQRIVHYLTRLVRSPEVAEELCQDTFLQAWRAWGQHDPQASAQGWLFRIATNTAYSYLRRARLVSFQRLDDGAEVAPQLAQPIDATVASRAALEDALTTLCPRDQRLLLLALHAGYRSSELAQLWNCTETAVRLRLHRARRRFRAAYGSTPGHAYT